VGSIKGEGAHVPLDRENLTSDELKLLCKMLEAPNSIWTGRGWREKMHSQEDPWNIRKAVSALSCLVGMDLIKSSKNRQWLTDEEKTLLANLTSSNLYWVSGSGTSWYKRAKQVAESEGRLFEIKQVHDPLNLWPHRPITKVVFHGNFGHKQPLIGLQPDPDSFWIGIKATDDSQYESMKALYKQNVKVTLELE